jgi:hypothetical protein
MTPERWERLKEIFSEAVAKEGPDREQYLLEACGGDVELLQSARGLIAGRQRAADFPSSPQIGPVSVEDQPLLFDAGELVAGRFHIVKFLARGGMGEVYEAEDLVLGQNVALKTIHRGLKGEQAVEHLKQEIQSARCVTHANVCRIYDIAEHGEPKVMLLTMELLDGPTLSRYIREHGPLTREEALPLIEQTVAGLQAAHDAGVIHRDFKSGNVILTGTPGAWRPVITDFGLALSPQSRQADTGLRAGTPGYMAPEQLEGKPATAATDVYALGVVIAAMLGARRLSAGDASPSPGSAAPQAVDDWKKLGPWRRVVERCLATDPQKRYQRPADVARALRRTGRQKWLLPIAGVGAAAAIGIVLLLPDLWPPPTRGFVTRKVMDEPATDMFWDVSADGRWLAASD